MRVLPVVAAGLVLASFAATGAWADGLPVLNVDVGASGVSAPDGTVRYLTVTVGKQTLVEATRRDGGQIVRMQAWPGTWTIPAVAYDGSASGLSADRRTLVLIEPRTSFPRAQTRLLVLNAHDLASATVVRFDGDYSFDAVSPNGSRIFLIHYLSVVDPTRYEVRAYDVSARKLVAKPIVDPRDATEKMRGNPLSRVMSPDGRFAYTLYDGNGHPFVHALDTAASTARCIDIAGLPRKLLWSLRLHLAGGGKVLSVDHGTRTFASLDTRTWQPPARAAGFRWWTVALALAVLSAVAAALAAAHRAGVGPASWAARRGRRRAASRAGAA
ncbi:MAG TPA: hypothetical protein VLJ44_11975 [Gaiellaceae bacterium]|nr:hypothetical protein [Gaiellaceae bacterium]